jgi:hypothetical protein
VSSGDDRYGIETVKTRFVPLMSQILDSWTAMGEKQSQRAVVIHYRKNTCFSSVLSYTDLYTLYKSFILRLRKNVFDLKELIFGDVALLSSRQNKLRNLQILTVV